MYNFSVIIVGPRVDAAALKFFVMARPKKLPVPTQLVACRCGAQARVAGPKKIISVEHFKKRNS